MKQIDVKKRVLAANDEAATSLRRRFADVGTLVLDLISSPGSGKTSLLEVTARRLDGALRLGAVVGDITTELDADRLRAAGLPAHQISTAGACHLDARMIVEALRKAPFGDVDVLFIENVGNLICPTAYDLGEDHKVALLSVTEGADKPFKYPGIFSKAAISVITKTDLLEHTTFDRNAAIGQIRTLNPDARVYETSIHGEGLEAWCGAIQEMLKTKRDGTLVTQRAANRLRPQRDQEL